MSEFVKKGVVGYKQVPGGQHDPGCSHVILTLEEYESLCQERDWAKKEQQAAQIWADSEVRKAITQGKDNLKRAEDTAKTALEEVGRQLVAAQEEASYQQGLNENLLRICRERANSARKLKPKKEHSGFVVVSSAEKEYRYKAGKNLKTVRLWETVLQSPYSVDFTEEQARRLIMEGLLQEDEDNLCRIEKLGIDEVYQGKYEDLREHPDDAKRLARQNIMMEQKLRANYRARYWEVTFFHTKALGQVPKDMHR